VAWKEAIDTYFAHQAFAVSVLAGRAVGRKPPAPTGNGADPGEKS
jgi:hypothetical protein